MSDHMTTARQHTTDAERYLIRHLQYPHGGPYDVAQITKFDIVMALLRTVQAMDCLLQTILDPDQQRSDKIDMIKVWEHGFREGVEAGGGTV
jgi:hypothetical protein